MPRTDEHGKPLAAAAPPHKSRVTVVETVHHVVEGEPGTTADNRYGRWSYSSNPAQVRRETATEDWKSLPWSSGAARVLVIRNEAGSGPGHARPTDRDLEGPLAAVVLEVGVAVSPQGQDGGPWKTVAFAAIHPGESMRLTPLDLGTLRIRCRSGEAPYYVFLVVD